MKTFEKIIFELFTLIMVQPSWKSKSHYILVENLVSSCPSFVVTSRIRLYKSGKMISDYHQILITTRLI